MIDRSFLARAAAIAAIAVTAIGTATAGGSPASTHHTHAQIPDSARVLDVEVSRHGKTLQSFTIDDARAVQKIAASIEALPTREPAAHACGYATDGSMYNLYFYASPTSTGLPLAWASQPLPVIPHCTFMRLTTGGHRQIPRERAGTVLREVKALRVVTH